MGQLNNPTRAKGCQENLPGRGFMRLEMLAGTDPGVLNDTLYNSRCGGGDR